MPPSAKIQSNLHQLIMSMTNYTYEKKRKLVQNSIFHKRKTLKKWLFKTKILQQNITTPAPNSLTKNSGYNLISLKTKNSLNNFDLE